MNKTISRIIYRDKRKGLESAILFTNVLNLPGLHLLTIS
jgi:hypothetical protein